MLVARVVLHVDVAVEADEAAVGELGERVDLGQRQAVLDEHARQRRGDAGELAELAAADLTLATSSLAMKSENGNRVEKWRLPMCSGCFSATSSMSMPPMSLKIITGLRAKPSQVTPT